MRMGRLRAWTVVAALVATLLLAFLLVEWLGLPLLVDPRPRLVAVSVAAALIGVGLLVVDAVLPIPSSVVMVALGATFGVVGGTALSIVGSLGGFALGYALGRRSRTGIVAIVDPADVARGAAMVRRWGVLAVVASRPLPLVAETVAICSGAGGMRTAPALAAALVGCAGPAAAFSWAGWRGQSAADGPVVFVLVALASGVCWVVGRRLSLSADRSPPPPAG